MAVLAELLEADAAIVAGDGAVPVTAVTADSRKVVPGALFVAVPGTRTDGLAFLPDAVARGAGAVIAERPPLDPPPGVALALVPNVRRALAVAAARFYPRQPAMTVAVTGTAGKTSVAVFTRQIWQVLGHPAAYLGTLGVITPARSVYGSLTTPDPVELHRALDELAGEGITHLALEASSHGLDQHRLDGLRITAGAFTNLGRDHLDYHPSMEAYLAAKLRLFLELMAPGAPAVIDLDAPSGAEVAAAARAHGLKVTGLGTGHGEIALESREAEGLAQRLVVRFAGESWPIRLPLVGAFQATNALIAAGLAIVTGGAPGEVFAALEGLEGVPGRLDLVGDKAGAGIFVDYAHKPDALGHALDALRPFARGRLVVVFGCGGDRDPGKRPIMGEVAVRKADRVIVTDDNPRSEDPAAIRRAILAAAPGAVEIGDRRTAIFTAIDALEPQDILLIAGKGHETGQILGDRTLPFSDHDVVREALGRTT